MYAQTVKSTEMRFRPRSRLATTKRTGFALEFGLKLSAAFLGAVGLICAMVCTYLYQSSGYMIPSSPAFYYTLKIIESASIFFFLFDCLFFAHLLSISTVSPLPLSRAQRRQRRCWSS